MSNELNQLKENYEIFLSKIDDYIEYLEEQGDRNNLSLDINAKDALVNLENFLKINNITVDDIEYEAASAYLGEFIRIHFNGEWELCLDKKIILFIMELRLLTGCRQWMGFYILLS